MSDEARSQRLELERRWLAFVEGAPAGGTGAAEAVRDEVLASWRRCATVIEPTIEHAPVDDGARARWSGSALAAAFAAVADELAQAATEGGFVAAVTDELGTIVWTAGGRSMRRRAERVGFVPGGCWDETAVGTNAPALALHDRRRSIVWSAEHVAPMVHDWVCYSAPILDPAGGRPLGVIDLSTTWRRRDPLASLTVGALARVVERALAVPVVPGPAPGGPAPLVELDVLGTERVRVGGTVVMLAPRHTELLVVLSLAAGGLRLEELHDRLYGERIISPGTTRAELSHLRRHLGPVLASRPYRFAAPVRADHLAVLDALDAGRLDDALDLYRGPLLPRSDAPAIVEHRHVLAMAIRTAVLTGGDADQHYRLARALPEDPWVQERALAQLGAGDPRRGIVLGQLARLTGPA